ncbi:hypothetical protein GCM10010329_37110 [Streptomyces spiroverticillatus]|uniref:Uncharacterized protein n=1 Tax=Streptomyces finlayi TaxID=67296 RepID=A0A918WYC8_9ACTN|nr:hypothetical protein GCM10010329_37110 [Streptomyces spiroverticillatus]GHC95335.1 hypothetical protein GCM10010334_34500 [Streptomyces finlayi]
MALSLVALAVAGWLLGVAVPQKVLQGRAYDAASGCPAGVSGDCLSGRPGTVERTWMGSGRSPSQYVEVAAKNGNQEFRLDRGQRATLAKGTDVRMVSWRGEVRHLNLVGADGRTSRTLFTAANPRTAHGMDMAVGLGLAFCGAGVLLLGLYALRHAPGGSREGSVPGTLTALQVPSLMLVLVGICAGVLALDGAPVGQVLGWTGWMVAAAVPIGGLMALWLRVRPAPPTGPVPVEARHPDRDRTFPVQLLGDRSGPGGFPRHTHLVAGPGGLLAFTVDPTGKFRREELPASLALVHVRHWNDDDPDCPADAGERKHGRVVELRDGGRTVLLGVHKRDAPWVVGALAERARLRP